MERSIRLGDVTVPRMGLGTNHLDYNAEHVSFVQEAVGAGIRHLDTAYRYRNGESEATIGAALAPFAADVVVATKAGISDGGGRPDVLETEIDESLRRLQTDTIALHYLHRVDPDVPVEACPSLSDALEKSENADRVVITGSLHFIGEAMEHLGFEVGKPGERSLNDWSQNSR